MRRLEVSVLLLLIVGTLGFAIWLATYQSARPPSRLQPASRKLSPPARLTLRVQDKRVRLNDPAKLTVTLTNLGRDEVFVTTNMDPFVSGTGLLRNYYFTMSGDCKPRQVARATLNFAFANFGELELLNIGAIALLKRGESYSGNLPVETWSTLATQPGRCWVQVHYRGEAPADQFSRPFLTQSLHSNYVEVEIVE